MAARLFESLFLRRGRRVEYQRGGAAINALRAIPRQVARTAVDAATSEEIITTATEWLIPFAELRFDAAAPTPPQRGDQIIDRTDPDRIRAFVVTPASGDDVADFHNAAGTTWIVHAVETDPPNE